jgi:alkylhydroperoxidase/carboxymuconolactone decarboxylase family protein YurZ
VYENDLTDEMIAEAVACAMFVAAGSQLSWSDVYEKIMGKNK